MDTDAFWAERTAELEEYARLAVRVGVNLEPGQDVTVLCYIEHAPLVRAIARVAYAEGARRVDSYYIDLHLRREKAAHAPDDVVGWTPPWMLQRVEEEAERRTAMINIVGEPEPDLFAGLDPARVAKSLMPDLRRAIWSTFDHGRAPWTIVAFPTPGWAEQVFGEPDVARLWDAVRGTVRLSDDDPIAAWKAHISMLRERASQLNERRFDAVRFRGPGTDLTVGLLPVADWTAAGIETSWGQFYVPNLPTEEVFTTPDCRRTQGKVRSTQPLVLVGGTVVRDLEMTFENGRVSEVKASTGGGRSSGRAGGRRQRVAARRGRARRRDIARRQERRYLLEHAVRRERRVARRLRHRRGRRRCAWRRFRVTRSSRRWASTARAPTPTS